MNPGAVEEVGKASGIFMNIMKDQPLALALCLMNLCLMALFFYIAQQATGNRRAEFQAIMDNNKEISKLLFNCVPVGQQRGEFKLQSDESHPVQLPPLPKPKPKEATDGHDDRSVHERSDQ